MAFPEFLPASVKDLSEETSIALAQAIDRCLISTPLSDRAIATTFVRRGTGDPAILLLHGFDSSVLEFRRLLPKLASKTETIAVDLLGFGFGDRPDNIPFSPTAIKTHLYAVWQTLISRPVVLVGASMSGAAAIDFTLTYPEAVDKLVLLDSAGLSPGPAIGKFLFPPFDRLATGFLRNPKVRQSISENAYFDKTFASVDARLCAALHLENPGWHRALVAFTKSGGYGSFAEKLGKIGCPTLIVWGRDDRILGTKPAAKFQQAIPNSRLVWIDRCGHVPHLERPDITAERILQFMGH